MLRFARLVTALALLLLLPSLALAQTRAGVVTNLEGSATAARSRAPEPVALKFKDDVLLNDRIVTGDRSIVRMLLGGKAVVTVRERSAFTITEVPGKSTINLDDSGEHEHHDRESNAVPNSKVSWPAPAQNLRQ